MCVCVCVYVQDYFRRQLGARPGGDVDQMSSDMESHVESTMALIRSSAPSPLLLSTLVYAFDTPDEVKAMPQSRLAIYTMAARTACSSVGYGVSSTDLYQILQLMAYDMQGLAFSSSTPSLSTLAARARDRFSNADVDRVLAERPELLALWRRIPPQAVPLIRTVQLRREGTFNYVFTHRSYQDSFAAERLVAVTSAPDGIHTG